MGECFPRTVKMPVQSPLFWVTHKDRYLRQLLIQDIEQRTKRDLLVYFTDVDNAIDAQIDPGDDQFLMELLKGKQQSGVDLLLETNGGFTDATEKVCSLLRSMTPDLRVIVPRKAKSNGTVVALTGSSIVMSASSELGPIDPHFMQIPCEFIVKDAGSYAPAMVRTADSFIKQTKTLATNLLASGMMKGEAPALIEDTVAKLATRDVYASHGSVIDIQEAKALGLKVEALAPTDELWEMIWLLRTMYAYDCPRNGYAKLFESARISSAVAVKPGTS